METQDLEKLATQRVQARLGFVVHALMYVAMNGGLVLLWTFTGAGYPWFMWPVTIWGVGLLAHGITLLIGPGSETERRATERELRRLRQAPR